MKVSELLSDKSKWCQHAQALDKDGDEVLENSPEAVKWCLLGAIYKCYGFTEGVKMAEKLRDLLPIPQINQWNDKIYRTFSSVRRVILRAGI